MAETWIDNLPHFMTTEAGRSAAQKAIAERDELLLKLETSQVALKGAEERAKMLLDAKSHWAERARTAESRLGAYREHTIVEQAFAAYCKICYGSWGKS